MKIITVSPFAARAVALSVADRLKREPGVIVLGIVEFCHGDLNWALMCRVDTERVDDMSLISDDVRNVFNVVWS